MRYKKKKKKKQSEKLVELRKQRTLIIKKYNLKK